MECGAPGRRNTAPGVDVAAYGQKADWGGISCASSAAGLECQNADGHGFFLSRARQSIVAGAPATGRAASACTEIRFAPGMNFTEIEDEAPPDDVLCFIIRTSSGQEARIQVLEGPNTIVTVSGVPDAEARQEIAFTTQSTSYEIIVGQLMRAVDPQPFRMMISVR